MLKSEFSNPASGNESDTLEHNETVHNSEERDFLERMCVYLEELLSGIPFSVEGDAARSKASSSENISTSQQNAVSPRSPSSSSRADQVFGRRDVQVDTGTRESNDCMTWGSERQGHEIETSRALSNPSFDTNRSPDKNAQKFVSCDLAPTSSSPYSAKSKILLPSEEVVTPIRENSEPTEVNNLVDEERRRSSSELGEDERKHTPEFDPKSPEHNDRVSSPDSDFRSQEEQEEEVKPKFPLQASPQKTVQDPQVLETVGNQSYEAERPFFDGTRRLTRTIDKERPNYADFPYKRRENAAEKEAMWKQPRKLPRITKRISDPPDKMAKLKLNVRIQLIPVELDLEYKTLFSGALERQPEYRIRFDREFYQT